MGKKGKKSRFNRVVDIDINYSSNSVIDGTAEHISNLHLTQEKVDELQRIKAQLPSAPQAVRLEEEVAKIPENGPFHLVLVNVSFTATKNQIEDFLLPVKPTNIRIAEEDGRFRGYCFIDFANRGDLSQALDKNGTMLLGRRVNMRIADRFGDRGGGGGFDREGGYNRRRTIGYDGGMSGGALPDGWRRKARPAALAGGFEGNSGHDERRWAPQSMRSGPESGPAPPPSEPVDRPIIKLAPRTIPVGDSAAAPVGRNRSIFGDAKPVDTAAKEREIEETVRQRNMLGDAKPVNTADRYREMNEMRRPAAAGVAAPASQKAQPVPVKKEEPEGAGATAEQPPKEPAAAPTPKPNAWAKPLV